MRNIDIRDLALHADETVRRLHRTAGAPLLIADGGEPLAVMIRHQVYAPRLDDFEMRQDGDVKCTLCGTVILTANPYNLGAAHRAANEHWRGTHQGKPTPNDSPRRKTPLQGSGYTPAQLLGAETE